MVLLIFLFAAMLQLAAGLSPKPASPVVATQASSESSDGVTCSPLPYLHKPEDCHVVIGQLKQYNKNGNFITLQPRSCAYDDYGAYHGELCNDDATNQVEVDQHDLAFQITDKLYNRCIISDQQPSGLVPILGLQLNERISIMSHKSLVDIYSP
ncbi:hypothetical protein QBC38DRAFT_452361 [Podospora fimiseda]|uniref:Ecp2 effector protein domain-containing protein n=1 Tax=Podospora fimiseda TaxID=252190 RepID=A0AAN7BW60_9PEZI|nr:hypothetical protein QBC38DRAFT_452361 [Podospora fimiseda]